MLAANRNAIEPKTITWTEAERAKGQAWGLPPGQEAPGTMVDDRTCAPFHQHFIVARLDMEVDGTAHTVYCCDSESQPLGEDNPLGLTLVQRQTGTRLSTCPPGRVTAQIGHPRRYGPGRPRNGPA